MPGGGFVGVIVAVGVRVGVLVGPPGVFVRVGVAVNVGVLVREGVAVGVFVGPPGVFVRVGVLVGPPPPGSVPHTNVPLR